VLLKAKLNLALGEPSTERDPFGVVALVRCLHGAI
jgi:hypothetical protein